MDHRKYNPDRYTRRSLRLSTHDYAATGAYFVTIRTYQSEPVLEEPELRKIVSETWQALPARFPNITLDEFALTTVAWLKYIKGAGLERSGRIWQLNYFDHILCSKLQLEQRRQYIRNNPTK